MPQFAAGWAAVAKSHERMDADSYFDDVPTLPDDLVVSLRNKMDLAPAERRRADEAIAAGCLALRQKFAATAGGKWEAK